MRTSCSPMLDYWPIDDLINLIDEPNRTVCKRLLVDHRSLLETVQGSTHNHQAWEGGYIDHITDGMNFARHLHPFMASFGRPLPFSLSDALLTFFLHDLEKPWRIKVDEKGEASNASGFATKADFQSFREKIIVEYGFQLTPAQINGYKYAEGEHKDYSSKRRVMNELAAFTHMVDNWCARGWYDYPKAQRDGWSGAKRFRTT